jgi:uncharacterized membrane protein
MTAWGDWFIRAKDVVSFSGQTMEYPLSSTVPLTPLRPRYIPQAKRKDIGVMQPIRLNQAKTEDHENDNPALSNVIERNIRTILRLRQKANSERSLQDRIADGITSFSGRMVFVFLSTLVLISQNRLSEEAEHRANLDLQIGLLTEHELTRGLQMLDAIQDKLGIENDTDSELADLEMETRPEDVLAEIARLQQQARRDSK